jgi:carbon monoxide dehydrogenase subunit G
MAKRNEMTVSIDRPIEQVFAFLADGENDKLFSERIIDIAKTTDGDTGVGTIYVSTARDMGRTARHEVEITVFDPPSRIHWRELSKGPVVISEGGYDLKPVGAGTELTFFGVLEGRGPGKLLVGLVARNVRRGLPAFMQSIKEAVEKHA